MANRNYLEQAKGFLMGRGARTAMHVATLALAAAGAANAATTFNTPTSAFTGHCGSSGGASIGGASVSGSLINAGKGVALFGNGTETSNSSNGDCLGFEWHGTGSGTFDSNSLPLGWKFTISTASGASISNWSLLVILNGGTNFLTSCQGATCVGPVNVTGQSMPVTQGATLSTYDVFLNINTAFTGSGGVVTATIPNGSIDLNPAPTGPITPTAPAASPVVLALTALGMAVSGWWMISRSKSEVGAS